MALNVVALGDVDGITIAPDGTKFYWTEGRSSRMIVRYPDGRMIKVYNDHPDFQSILDAECVSHEMTQSEEDEYDRMIRVRGLPDDISRAPVIDIDVNPPELDGHGLRGSW